MVRGALLALLALEQDLTVVADVADGHSVLPTALQHRPDVAIIDIDLPGKDGITAAIQVRTALPGLQDRYLDRTRAPRNGPPGALGARRRIPAQGRAAGPARPGRPRRRRRAAATVTRMPTCSSTASTERSSEDNE